MIINAFKQRLLFFLFLLSFRPSIVKYLLTSGFSLHSPVDELLIKPGNLTQRFPYNFNCKNSFYSYENKPDCRTVID